MGRLCLVVLALATRGFAGEYVVLTTGAILEAERHELDGAKVRLYANQGVIELERSAVARFEPAEVLPRPAATEPAPPAAAPPDPRKLVEDAARRYATNPEFIGLVHSVARAESGYRPDAVSPKGAIGLMQLMPGTAKVLNADPNQPEQNADAGARHLRDLLLKYKDDPWQVRKALAAYNAGAGAVDRYQGVPPYPETMQYVERVIRNYKKLQR